MTLNVPGVSQKTFLLIADMAYEPVSYGVSTYLRCLARILRNRCNLSGLIRSPTSANNRRWDTFLVFKMLTAFREHIACENAEGVSKTERENICLENWLTFDISLSL